MRQLVLPLLAMVSSTAALADEAYFLRETRTGSGLTKLCVYQHVEPYVLTMPAHQLCPDSIDTDALAGAVQSAKRSGGGYTGAEYSLGFVEGFQRRRREQKVERRQEEDRALALADRERRIKRESADAAWQEKVREHERREWEAEPDRHRTAADLEVPRSADDAIRSAEGLLKVERYDEAWAVAKYAIDELSTTAAQRRTLTTIMTRATWPGATVASPIQ